jgi:CubicO group peptidase (beta-lactamase class C family)
MQELISHHSGLPVFPDNLVDRDGDGRRDVGIDPRSPASGYAREHLAQALGGFVAPMDVPYLYSNLGLGLAGLALEDHLDLPGYHATLRRLVTVDLGMNETWGEVDAIDPDALSRLAEGQAVDGSTRVPGILGRMGVLASAGEIVTTGDDMALFLGAMIGARATPLEDAIVLATTPLAPGPMDRDMGYAIEIEHRAEGDVLRKGGNTSSYSAYVMWSRSPAIGAAVLTNCGSFMAVVELTEQLHDGARAIAR